MTTLAEHPLDCECERCEVLMRKAFDETINASQEDRRWAQGLARLRRGLDISQSELANKMAMQKSAISELESGKRPLTIRTLRRLGAILGLSTLEVLKQLDARDPDEELRHQVTVARRQLQGGDVDGALQTLGEVVDVG